MSIGIGTNPSLVAQAQKSRMAQKALHHIEVQNVLARYCFAIDNKTFDQLSDVFTEDVKVSYPIQGFEGIDGLQALQEALQKR